MAGQVRQKTGKKRVTFVSMPVSATESGLGATIFILCRTNNAKIIAGIESPGFIRGILSAVGSVPHGQICATMNEHFTLIQRSDFHEQYPVNRR
jgi:uncharacterized membrane protein